MLVIPSDNFGGVSSFVYDNIHTYNLPYFSQKISLGSVHFKEITGGFNNAFIIGYAAAVDATTYQNRQRRHPSSSVEIIEQIMLSILRYAKDNSIKKINIPLLGTGSGNISFRESFLAIIKHFKDDDISLNVYVLTKEIYDDLAALDTPVKLRAVKVPRVFISYTGYDKENGKFGSLSS